MQKRRVLKPSIVNYISKTLIVTIITLVILILMKGNSNFKTKFYKYVYDTSYKFSDAINLYHKYFGNIYNVSKTETVSSDKLSYGNIEAYYDGAKLSVGSNYAVPIIESGIVVFIGNKDNFGNTVIVQQINGIDMWYGNISDSSIKLYDYVSKGSILGNCNNYLYVLFKKDGNILPYEENL